MMSIRRRFAVLVMMCVAMTLPQSGACQAPPATGIVILHGKGGTPGKHVAALAGDLERQGYLVANLEMPWSTRRQYDVDVSAADREVEAALDALRNKGARQMFIAGHSQGGVFALHFGVRHALDGIVAIAPGGDVGSPLFRKELGDYVELARKMVAEGKGSEKARFFDTEGKKGTFPVVCTASSYLGWFDPEGAMNMQTAVKNMNPHTPVLFLSPRDDYPGLLKTRQSMFDALPPHPLNQFRELDSTHMGAPSASGHEIVRWISAVESGTK